jgi:hypothetical protein
VRRFCVEQIFFSDSHKRMKVAVRLGRPPGKQGLGVQRRNQTVGDKISENFAKVQFVIGFFAYRLL